MKRQRLACWISNYPNYTIGEIWFFLCWRLRVKGWEMINHAGINWIKGRTVLTIRLQEQLCVARKLSMLTHDCKPSTSEPDAGGFSQVQGQYVLHSRFPTGLGYSVRICVNTKTPEQRKFPETYWTMKKEKDHWSQCGTYSICSYTAYVHRQLHYILMHQTTELQNQWSKIDRHGHRNRCSQVCPETWHPSCGKLKNKTENEQGLKNSASSNRFYWHLYNTAQCIFFPNAHGTFTNIDHTSLNKFKGIKTIQICSVTIWVQNRNTGRKMGK